MRCQESPTSVTCDWVFSDGRSLTTHARELETSQPHVNTFTFTERNVGRVDVNITCRNVLSSKVTLESWGGAAESGLLKQKNPLNVKHKSFGESEEIYVSFPICKTSHVNTQNSEEHLCQLA